MSEDEKDTLIVLLSIHNKFKYTFAIETVTHYLLLIYPHPSTLNKDDDGFYYETRANLVNLLKSHL